MANDRFLLKQFAGNASNNGIFGSAQQGTGTVATDIKQVQSLNAFENGWNSATMTADKLPCLEEFQGVQALLCKAIKETISEGVPQWLSTETYYQDSYCVYNGVLYRNTTGTYTTNNPALDTTNWEVASITNTELTTRLALKLDKANATSKGSATLPVYFDANGVAQPITSYEGTSAISNKLGSATIGSVTTPIYLANGVPTTCNSIPTTSLPIGTILPYGGSSAPSGFLLCNGGAISRTTYASLYAVIGTAYGSGDGSTTFNLPNGTSRSLWGNTNGQIAAGLPNITGTFKAPFVSSSSGCFTRASSDSCSVDGTMHSQTIVTFNSSNSSSIYGNSTTVQPPSIGVKFIIKF